MSAKLSAHRIVILATDGVGPSEFVVPEKHLIERGATVHGGFAEDELDQGVSEQEPGNPDRLPFLCCQPRGQPRVLDEGVQRLKTCGLAIDGGPFEPVYTAVIRFMARPCRGDE